MRGEGIQHTVRQLASQPLVRLAVRITTTHAVYTQDTHRTHTGHAQPLTRFVVDAEGIDHEDHVRAQGLGAELVEVAQRVQGEVGQTGVQVRTRQYILQSGHTHTMSELVRDATHILSTAQRGSTAQRRSTAHRDAAQHTETQHSTEAAQHRETQHSTQRRSTAHTFSKSSSSVNMAVSSARGSSSSVVTLGSFRSPATASRL